jgi:hypothetical protein
MEGSGEQWSAGYAAAMADAKRTRHALVAAIPVAVARLNPGGAAWLAAVERNGGTEYGGAGQPRVPVDQAAIELARNMLKGRAR